MVPLLYTLPHWAMGLVITLGLVALALAAYPWLHKLWPATPQAPLNPMPFVQMLVGLIALLTAFTSMTVWNTAASASGAVRDEANEASQLAWDLGVYGTPEALEARAALENYLGSVLEQEWPRLVRGDPCEEESPELHAVFRAVGKVEAKTPREEVILGEIWARANALVKFRRMRLNTSRSGVPDTLWMVLLLCIALAFGTVFVLPPSRATKLLIAAMAGGLGLTLFFIVAIDHPFEGKECVRPTPFRTALDHMRHYDRTGKD